MGVEKTGHEELIGDIHSLASVPLVRPDAGDDAVRDDDVGHLDPLREHIDNVSPHEQQIAGRLTARHPNSSLELFAIP